MSPITVTSNLLNTIIWTITKRITDVDPFKKHCLEPFRISKSSPLPRLQCGPYFIIFPFIIVQMARLRHMGPLAFRHIAPPVML